MNLMTFSLALGVIGLCVQPASAQVTDVKGWAIIKSPGQCMAALGNNDSTVIIAADQAGRHFIGFVAAGRQLPAGSAARYWITYSKGVLAKPETDAIVGASAGPNGYGSTIITDLSEARYRDLPSIFSIAYTDMQSIAGGVVLHDTADALAALESCRRL